MTDHVDRIVAETRDLAEAFDRFGIIPQSVLELREVEAEAAFYQAWKDPALTREQAKELYLAWQAAVFDRVFR